MPLEWYLLLGFDKTFISIFAANDIGVFDVTACHTIGQIYLQPRVDLNKPEELNYGSHKNASSPTTVPRCHRFERLAQKKTISPGVRSEITIIHSRMLQKCSNNCLLLI